MKALKNITTMLLSLCVLITSSGCSNSHDHSGSDENIEGISDQDVSDSIDNSGGDPDNGYIGSGVYDNVVLPIYNAENQEIGSITCYGYSLLTNGCILYSKVPENSSMLNAQEYWLYDIEAKENHMLGTVDCRYEAYYEAIESDGHLYLSVSSGAYGDRENNKLTIYDVDLSEYSMSPILEVEKGFSYNSYTIANGKLILAELLYNEHTDLVEYDLTEKHDAPVVHAYDESDEFSGDSIRHICADGKNIYMVRLHRDETDNYALYLDTYDFDYNLLNTADIGEFCVSTHVERTDESKKNERGQFISHFFIHNDLVYYENFSTTTAIGTLKDGKIDRLFDTNSGFHYVNTASEEDSYDLFIQRFGDDTRGRNIFYRVNHETHAVETAGFYADNRNYTFIVALRDGDKILLNMGNVRKTEEDVQLPERLYYIDMNDLDFKPME